MGETKINIFYLHYDVYQYGIRDCVVFLLPPAYAAEVMFWSSWHRNLIFVFWYILTTSRTSLSIKVTGSRSRSYIEKMLIWPPGHQFNLVWLVWGQGHSKVKLCLTSIGNWRWAFDWKAFLLSKSLKRSPSEINIPKRFKPFVMC